MPTDVGSLRLSNRKIQLYSDLYGALRAPLKRVRRCWTGVPTLVGHGRVLRFANMSDFRQVLSDQFLEMRWRCLSLAADMDRLQRSVGSSDAIRTDADLAKLRDALAIVASTEPNRAERLQMLFSDQTRESCPEAIK
jgi:hypothetical protein